jgi:hypothetical protein
VDPLTARSPELVSAPPIPLIPAEFCSDQPKNTAKTGIR